MSVAIKMQTYEVIPLEKISSKLDVRPLSPSGLKRILESMRWAGFLENHPLLVELLEDGTYRIIDGNHRYEAAKSLGIASVPCIVVTGLSEFECYRRAIQCNNATESMVPSTLVTNVLFIRRRLAEQDTNGKLKYVQADVGDILGWSRESVRDYVALQKICNEAWDIIGATFEKIAPADKNGSAPNAGADAPFTEGLLRPIVHLTSKQQVELVRDLAGGKIEKGAFTKLAKAYRARNELKDYSLKLIRTLGEAYAEKLIKSVDSGAYDSEWQSDKEHKEHPKLDKLLKAIRDEWEQKSSYRFIEGNFSDKVKDIDDGIIDLILTDPPYNIARDNEFELEGRSNISQDFGEWDKYSDEQFIDFFKAWAREWARILRHQGSGYVFTSDSYISHLRTALEDAGLHVKATIIWHKTNPGTQIVKTGFKSSIEYILFFTKGEGGHTFNWQGENEMHNFIESPICQGRERRVDAKGRTLHPTQKPERVLEHFLKISSNRGDMVFDGFMGVGSTGKVAKDQGRKFIGIELDKTYIEDAQRRLEE